MMHLMNDGVFVLIGVLYVFGTWMLKTERSNLQKFPWGT